MSNKLARRVGQWLMIVACGGAAFQLEGCNPSVRGAVLTGLETVSLTLASTMITTLFDGLGENGS